MEDGFFNTLTLLLTIVVQQAEGITSQDHDGDEVAGREECHEEIDDVPDKFKAGYGTKDDHDTCRADAVDGHYRIVRRDEADVGLAIIIVADDAGECKEQNGYSNKDWSCCTHLRLQGCLCEGDTV